MRIEARILWQDRRPGAWRPVDSPSLAVNWGLAFRSADHDLRGTADDRDCDGFWSAVLDLGDGDWAEIDLPHDGTRVPPIADVVAALDPQIAKPHQITVELGFAARHGGRGPLQLELEIRPAAEKN